MLLHNLEILYDYILDNNFNIPKAELFTGEIWHTQFGLDVLDLTLKYLQKGMKIDWFVIASNCSFLMNEHAFYQIQHYIDEFSKIGNRLCFSISVDGEIIDNAVRPRNNHDKYIHEFYERAFAFATHNNYFFHPMVSAESISLWKENYEWWKQQFEAYGLDVDTLMMLEVRNNGWTEQNIKDYCDFLEYLCEDYKERKCNGNNRILAKIIANEHDSRLPHLGGYVPWIVGGIDSFMGCTVAIDLTVRLGDLAICPCHRTAYKEYLYGKFVVENDKIVDIEAINPYMAIKILMGNIRTSYNKCDTCPIVGCCLMGCLGSQLETMKDPFFQIPNICDFFIAKYSTIFRMYKKWGIIDYLESIPPERINYDHAQDILRAYYMWRKGTNEMEEY